MVRSKTVRALIALLFGLAASPAAAQGVRDCPMRDTPFSLGSPFIDLLLSPPARAVFEQAAPGALAKLPANFASTTTPSFAAILTVREAASFTHLDPAQVTAIETGLRTVPVTAADRVARCARYDDGRPVLRLPAGRPRLLLFEKITGFRDGPSVDAGQAAFFDLAKRKGWAIVATDQAGAFTPRTLSRFDAVIWNNVSGDVLTLSQRAALRAFVEGGGGFIGVHGSGGDPAYFWDWYVDTLIGARFVGHPNAKHFQDARVVLDPAAGPIARGLPAEWTMNDEWYSFAASPRASGAHVIATLDESSYDPVATTGTKLRMGDHPIVWSRCVGRGRSFYSAIGHRPETYADPQYRTLLENAVGWAANRAAPCGKAGG